MMLKRNSAWKFWWKLIFFYSSPNGQSVDPLPPVAIFSQGWILESCWYFEYCALPTVCATTHHPPGEPPSSLNMITCHYLPNWIDFFFWEKWRWLTHICDTLSSSSVNGAMSESGESEGKLEMDNSVTVWQKMKIHSFAQILVYFYSINWLDKPKMRCFVNSICFQ